RHYDEIGLITPSERSSGGFRLYSEADVERILLIRRMKPLDFTLEQMRELLEITEAATRPGTPDAVRQKLREVEESALERRAALPGRLPALLGGGCRTDPADPADEAAGLHARADARAARDHGGRDPAGHP